MPITIGETIGILEALNYSVRSRENWSCRLPLYRRSMHLVGTRLGREARMTFYSGLVEGAYFVADLPRDGYQRALELNEQFADLDLGFVDASVVVIAGRARGTADRHD